MVFQQWHCHSWCAATGPSASFDVTKFVCDDIVVGNNDTVGNDCGDDSNDGSDDDTDDVDDNNVELISVDNVDDIFTFISFDIASNEP